MDAHNLNAASEYVNGLLLARGLLRNGKPIEFSEPSRASDGDEGTMTRVINLIHDLIMRRDRDAEQHENLASTIRALRNTETKQSVEIERLEGRVDELGRSLALTEGQERAFKASIRDAEGTIRTLKEQVQRMKSTVTQIRAQYVTDIRKRDLEMQKLKARVTERTRGKRDGPGVTTITIIPPPKSNCTGQRPTEGGDHLNAPGYSLRQETTEFLTQLCQNLSDENDSLIRLTQDSISTLKELQGLPETETGKPDLGQEGVETGPDSMGGTVPSYERLSTEMAFVLCQLRALLTNPSFVSLEEVEIRDTEISRLRDGWEKMEEKWKEAIAMMDNWHNNRMASSGDGLNKDGFKLSLSLGSKINPTITRQEVDIRSEGDIVKQAAQKNTDGDGDSEHTDFEKKDPAETPAEALVTPRKRTVKFAKKDEGVLGECSGNRQSRRLSSKAAVTADPENVVEKEDIPVQAENSETADRRKRQPKKDADTKIGPRTRRTMIRPATSIKPSPVRSGAAQLRPRVKKRSSTSGDVNPRSRRRRSAFYSKELEKMAKIAD